MNDDVKEPNKEVDKHTTETELADLGKKAFEQFTKMVADVEITDEDLKRIYTPVPDPESYPPEFVKIESDTVVVRADVVAERRFNDLMRRLAEKGKHFKNDV